MSAGAGRDYPSLFVNSDIYLHLLSVTSGTSVVRSFLYCALISLYKRSES